MNVCTHTRTHTHMHTHTHCLLTLARRARRRCVRWPSACCTARTRRASWMRPTTATPSTMRACRAGSGTTRGGTCGGWVAGLHAHTHAGLPCCCLVWCCVASEGMPRWFKDDEGRHMRWVGGYWWWGLRRRCSSAGVSAYAWALPGKRSAGQTARSSS